MQYTKWKKRAIPYDPMRGLRVTDVRAFRSSVSHEQPHKQWLYQWRDYSKKEHASTGLYGELVFTGCDCYACAKYYGQIWVLNPLRCKAMLGLSYSQDSDKAPSPHVGIAEDGRDMLSLMGKYGAVSLRPVFVQRISAVKKVWALEKHIRDTNGIACPKWRG